MEKVLLAKHRSKKEGVTLIETLVAIAIVVIVSAAAASVAVYSSNAIKNATVRRFFQNEVDTIAGIYLTYEGAEFSRAMNDFCGVLQDSADGTYFYYYTVGFTREATEETHAYKLQLTLNASKLTLASTYKDGSAIYNREVAR